MKTLTLSEAEHSFGDVLDLSKREPVCIEERGHGLAVVLSMAEYERLSELEDRGWGLRAEEAAKSGFLGPEESAALLDQLSNAQD